MIAILMIAIIVLWILFIAVLPTNFDKDNAFAMIFEKSIPFVIGSFYLGTLIAEHGFSYILLVFQDGELWEKSSVVVPGIGIVLIILVEILIRRRLGYCIRDLLSLASSFVLGYAIMKVLFFLYSITPFPLSLIFAFMPIAQGILIIAFVFSILIWFIPNGTLAAMNRDREARERAAMAQKRHHSSGDDVIIDEPDYTPVYVTDDDGNQYPVEMRGDYIVIRGPHGEVSTRWEYVKGQPYFDLNGSRFFPH